MATRSDYAYYPKLWHKSFLIEIVRKDSGELHRSFAFSLPPESVKIQVPQRVNVRKTFGGVFVDDYGIDSLPINLKGTTGNSQLKEVYFNSGTRYIDGKNEAALIVREILQYKYQLTDYEKFELRLFDLSSVAEAIDGAMLSKTQLLDANGWRVVLKDGSIERSKEKPFFFDYSLEFLAVEPIGIKRYGFAAYETSALELLLAAAEKAGKLAAALKKALADYRSFVDKIKLVEEVLRTVQGKTREFFKTIQGFVSTTADGVNSVFDIIAFPADLTKEALLGVRGVRDEFENIWTQVKEGVGDIETKGQQIAEICRDLFGLEESTAEMTRQAKAAGAIPEVHLVPADSPGSKRVLNATDPGSPLDMGYMLTYGYTTVVASSATRLDSLALSAYGSPDYASMIAKFNGITSDADISPGMEIKLPYLAYTPALQASEVYALGGETYGTDIALAPDGDVVLAESNDYGLISGMSNMKQAVALRLAEDQGSRVRLLAYGIKQSRGSFDPFSLAVLITSIRDTLIQDARIQGAYGFALTQDGDFLRLNFEMELEGGATAQYTIGL